jgi:hypothetical protein
MKLYFSFMVILVRGTISQAEDKFIPSGLFYRSSKNQIESKSAKHFRRREYKNCWNCKVTCFLPYNCGWWERTVCVCFCTGSNSCLVCGENLEKLVIIMKDINICHEIPFIRRLTKDFQTTRTSAFT